MSASLNKAPFRLQHPVVESDREIAPQGQMSATPSPGYPHICSSDASSTPSHLSGKPGSAECLRWQNGIRLGLRRLFDTKRAGRLFCGSRECVGLSLRMPAFGWLHCASQAPSTMRPSPTLFIYDPSGHTSYEESTSCSYTQFVSTGRCYRQLSRYNTLQQPTCGVR
ncbi:hypothetical protein BD309DRAFT_954859 [Dichomitus squalens]|nr:hypothetical protein BD309DRAFT_954859 [Dichomitus squalens]